MRFFFTVKILPSRSPIRNRRTRPHLHTHTFLHAARRALWVFSPARKADTQQTRAAWRRQSGQRALLLWKNGSRLRAQPMPLRKRWRRQ